MATKPRSPGVREVPPGVDLPNPPGLPDTIETESEVLVYVPPSQQNAQRPVAKPGEPVVSGTVPTPAPVRGRLATPSVEMAIIKKEQAKET
jgi:hypothetical protein